jgi:hypothetical protein
MNSLNSSERDDVRNELISRLESRWPRLWLAYCHHQTTRGKPLEWETRPWLIPIYKDDCDRIVIQKSSQIGISEWALCELFVKAKRGRSVMYVLPTEDMVWRFTPRRIGRLLGSVPFYQGAIRMGSKDSNTKKQITLFGTDCHIAGSQATNNFFEIPADLLIVDELDQCNQDNINLALTRLGSATDDEGKAIIAYRMVGNPSVSGRGISEAYQNSDKRQWFVPCGHCGHRQALDWFSHFVNQDDAGDWFLRHNDESDEDAMPVCERCGLPMDRLAAGEWVAQYPDRDVHGYHCSKLFGDGRRGAVIREMFNQFESSLLDQTKLQQFYNQWLGLPYKAEGTGFTREIILRGLDNSYLMPGSERGCTMGADVGSWINVTISKPTDHVGVHRLVYVGRVRDFDDLHRLWYQYGVARGVIDAAPEERLVKDFCKHHPGMYACRYSLGKEAKETVVVDHVKREIKCKRTPTLDELLATWQEGRVVVPNNVESLDGGDFVTQLCAATRYYDDKRQEYVWDEGNQADHYHHAENYRNIAVSHLSGSGLKVM